MQSHDKDSNPKKRKSRRCGLGNPQLFLTITEVDVQKSRGVIRAKMVCPGINGLVIIISSWDNHNAKKIVIDMVAIVRRMVVVDRVVGNN
jgi:hypothetical protein